LSYDLKKKRAVFGAEGLKVWGGEKSTEALFTKKKEKTFYYPARKKKDIGSTLPISLTIPGKKGGAFRKRAGVRGRAF